MFKRFFTMTTATVLFCILVAGLSMLFFFVHFWRDNRLNRLSDDALSLARSVSVFYEAQDGASPEATGFLDLRGNAPALLTAADDFELYITDLSGRVLLCRDAVAELGEDVSVLLPCAVHNAYSFGGALPAEAAAASAGVFGQQETLEDYPDRAGATPVPDRQYLLAAAVIRVRGVPVGAAVAVQSLSAAYLPYTTVFVRMLLFTSILAVFTAFILSVIVSYRMVKPLKTVTAATRKVAGGDFSERIEAGDTYSELADLVESFNGMAESLARMDASRSAFVANISHELKTPMTIISGFIDGILDHTIPPEDEARYLKIVSDETKRLSRLVVAMLNLSRIEAGKLRPVLSDVALDRLLLDTLVGFEMAVREKDIEITGLDALAGVTVQADETLFSQIIYNLIDNAVKFTPYGGEITFTLTADRKNAELGIRNTGRGIPPEECALIFDRFYKVDKSRGLDARSFGLGLYIVKQIVELHGGTIAVNSEEGEYTEFVIRLPLRQENPA